MHTIQINHTTILRSGLLAVLSLMGIATADAQELRSVWFGGIGVGIAAHDNSSFSDRLQSWSPPGPDGREMVYRTTRFASTGYTLNAGANLLLGGAFMIGASGERLMFPTVEAVTTTDERSTYTLTGGGGGLELGYALVNDDATFAWPYASIGYYGYGLDFANEQSDSVGFFESAPIAPGTETSFSGAGPRIGIGFGFSRFIGGAGGGSSVSGWVLGARLHYGRYLSCPEWEGSDLQVVNGGHTPCYSALSLTVSIGGGGSF